MAAPCQPAPVSLTVLPSGLEVEVVQSESIVDGLRRAGWRAAYKCRRGGCGACRVRLVQGEVSYLHPVAESVLGVEDRDEGGCLPCRAYPRTDVVIDLGTQMLRPVLATNRLTTPPTTNTPALELLWKRD